MTGSLRTLAVVAALGAPLVLAGPALADTTSDLPAVMATTSPSPSPSGVVMGTDSNTSTASPSATTSTASPSATTSSSEESQVTSTPSGGADTGSGATQEERTSANTLAAGGLLLLTAAGATVWASRRRVQN